MRAMLVLGGGTSTNIFSRSERNRRDCVPSSTRPRGVARSLPHRNGTIIGSAMVVTNQVMIAKGAPRIT